MKEKTFKKGFFFKLKAKTDYHINGSNFHFTLLQLLLQLGAAVSKSIPLRRQRTATGSATAAAASAAAAAAAAAIVAAATTLMLKFLRVELPETITTAIRCCCCYYYYFFYFQLLL